LEVLDPALDAGERKTGDNALEELGLESVVAGVGRTGERLEQREGGGGSGGEVRGESGGGELVGNATESALSTTLSRSAAKVVGEGAEGVRATEDGDELVGGESRKEEGDEGEAERLEGKRRRAEEGV
jgi:hypothetical protein